ncbi:MAG TPA: transposase, partial [Gemmataceae bacterium]
MPRFRRSFVPGGTFFFTLVTEGRSELFLEGFARALLRRVIKECRARWPFAIDAMVLLPEHLHSIWTMPLDDWNYSRRWGWIKKEFSKRWLRAGRRELPISPAQRQEPRRGIWQPRFWEHTIRDESDLERCFDCIHYN